MNHSGFQHPKTLSVIVLNIVSTNYKAFGLSTSEDIKRYSFEHIFNQRYYAVYMSFNKTNKSGILTFNDQSLRQRLNCFLVGFIKIVLPTLVIPTISHGIGIRI